MNVDEGTTSSQTPEGQEGTSSSEQQNTNQAENQNQNSEENKPLISGDKKEGGDQQQAEFVPLTAADITFPEGLEVNETLRDEALAIVNNRELSPKDQLQGLINLQAKLANEASETISKTWENTQQAWKDEVKADPTIGGDKLQTTLAAVNKLATEYGSDELFEALAVTGAGNNVHVIKFLNNIAGKLLEGKPVIATSPGNQEEDRAVRMFPSMKPS